MSRKTFFGIGASRLLLVTLALTMPAGAQMDSTTAGQNVRVTVIATDESGKALRVEVTTSNSGQTPVYIMAEPQRSDRSRGLYIEESPNDPSLIFCTAQLYPSPPFNMYFNATHVRLLLLKPGENHVEKIDIPFPVRTTEPPFAASPGTRELTGPMKRIEAVVGVLPQTEELDRLLARKVGHDSITGFETVRGRFLYKIQQLVRSAAIEIEKVEK